MEFPKKLLIVIESGGAVYAGQVLDDFPDHLLEDGAEVGVYLYRRTKRVEVSRKLVKADPADTEPDEDDPPAAPAEQQLPLEVQ